MFSALAGWLLSAPIWLIGLVLYALMVAAALAGWKLRQYYRRREQDADKEKDISPEGYIVSAVMGLLALLVGFTFALAIDRYDARKGRVLDEANAIGTTYLRTQLLEAPHRARITQLLSDYTDTRIALGNAHYGSEQSVLLEKSNGMITDLWTATVAAFPTIRSYDFSNSYLESMNDLIDMDAARQQSRRAHVPLEVFLALIAYQTIAAAVLGCVLSASGGRRAAVVLLILFGGTLMLIIDIDRPTGGGIRESQEPMLQLQASIRAQSPAVFDRLVGKAPPQDATAAE